MMNEVLGKQEWQFNARGQCFSFIMPWSQLIQEFQKRSAQDELLMLPRGPETLQYLFRIHLRVAGQEFAGDLRQVRLRSWVLLRLLAWLWERRRDLFPRYRGGRATFLDAMTKRVRELYPESASEAALPEDARDG